MSAVIQSPADLPLLDATLCQQLQEFMLTNIPLSRAMQVELLTNGHDLIIQAPLEPNVNDKGTGFGGAINNLLTLSGWSWTWMINAQHNFSREIVIQKARCEFIRPVQERLKAICYAPSTDCYTRYMQAMQRKGKARIKLDTAVVLQNGEMAARQSAEYVTLADQ